MLKHREELADESDVTWLDDQEELIISGIWLLAIENSSDGWTCDYQVVKDCCKEHRLESTSVYRVCKYMTNELNK